MLLVSHAISVLCVLVLTVTVVFDAQAERFTAGRVPAQSVRDVGNSMITAARDDVTVVAHNAGDDLAAATKAVAYGADAIEIDVRSAGDELLASHDAPVPLLEDLVFRGPSLDEAWDIAQLRDAVLLHLKERSPRFLAQVLAFVKARPIGRITFQTSDADTLRALRRSAPSAQRLLLVLNRRQLQSLKSDAGLRAAIDGVSVRETLLSANVQAWLESRSLTTFAWTVNDERRLNQLLARGADGIITDRLDFMRLLGEQPEATR